MQPCRAVTRPLVKWAGGKTKLLPELIARVPDLTGGWYYEPFAGGAALYLALHSAGRLRHCHSMLSDLNQDLIDAYRAVAVNPHAVIHELAGHAVRHLLGDEGYYYQVRDSFNDRHTTSRDDLIRRAGMFIYLNRACYNGLWRVNRRGELNVPRGDYDSLSLPDIDHILEVSAALGATEELRCEDAETVTLGRGLEEYDFVYFDPPYDGGFASYCSGGFSADDQRRLALLFRDLAGDGVRVMASNADTPLVRELYAGYRIDRVTCARPINSSASGRGRVGEVIITSGYLGDEVLE